MLGKVNANHFLDAECHDAQAQAGSDPLAWMLGVETADMQ